MKHEIELQPFSVPNYVLVVKKPGRRDEGMKEVPSFHVGELSLETLEEMCKQFRLDVHAKANAYREEKRPA